MSYQTIIVEVQNSILQLRLNRPEVNNAFNQTMIDELTSVFLDANFLRDIRAIVISGNGKNFSAGADLSYMKHAASLDYDQNLSAAIVMSELFRAMDRCPVPVIGKVHGAALGGGFGLCACCDIVIASSGTVFALSEIRLGILPAVIGPFTIAKIGYSHFRALGITGERFDAEKAKSIGLIHEVVSPSELDSAVEKKLELIGGAGPQAVKMFKEYARELGGVDTDDVRKLATSLISTARTSAEGKEGIGAFLEKRTANWVVKLP